MQKKRAKQTEEERETEKKAATDKRKELRKRMTESQSRIQRLDADRKIFEVARRRRRGKGGKQRQNKQIESSDD